MSQPPRLRIGVLSAVVLSLSSFACVQARAAEQQKDEGWCTISAPDAVRPGEGFAVGGTGEAAFDCTAPQGGDAKAVYALI